ncbi:carbohydrate kinase family protein [Streptomyces paludis]|uniref:Carbohydrate kinase n=1 Tax=Streptomyces paludis TaxID=2282738 RepID=A0A345HUQ5_9ACTN|nr:carbohydrate kinase [Streptomyces paludis]AXG80429.1 carbohydrate kinase [Streptomyces paludis]
MKDSRTHDRPSALVVGESVLDIVDTPQGRTRHPGGSPMNVAVGLARLGVPTQLFTQLGADTAGALIAGHLREAGVEIVPASFTASPTNTATATLHPDGSAEYAFVMEWAPPGPVPLPAVELIHVGSLGAFLRPGADTVEDFLARVPDSVTISFDPNIRPSLLHDRTDAVQRFERLARRADIVKLSDEDAAWLYPARSDAHVLAGLLDAGAELAIITLGAKGAKLATPAATATVPAPTVQAVDTIGAGDSFMSAILATLLNEQRPPGPLGPTTLEHLGTRAALAAALTVQREAAQPPTQTELHTATSPPPHT